MPKEDPVGLADKHPKTLVSGLWMHHVTKGKGAESLPLPAAQEGNPGVSEGLTVHRRCLRGRSKVYFCHGVSIAASATMYLPGFGLALFFVYALVFLLKGHECVLSDPILPPNLYSL
jgi:hypothetical protein